MLHSLRWRIAIPFVVLLLGCIIGLSLYVADSMRDRYIADLEVRLTDQAHIVADACGPHIEAGQSAEVDSLAKRLGEHIDERLTIVALDGQVLGDSEEDVTRMETHVDRPEIQQALAEGVASATRYSSTLGEDMMYVAVAVDVNGDTVGVARVALSLSQIDQHVAEVNRNIIIASIIAALAAVALTLGISSMIIGPVRKLTESSQRLAKGELDHRILVTSSEEIGELGRAFNRMADRIRDMVGLLSAERDRMATILSHMSEAVLVVGRDGRVILINETAERMFEVSRTKAMGKTFIEVVRDHEVGGLLQRCRNTGAQSSALIEIRSRRQYLGVTATPLLGEGGFLVVLHDLSEVRRMETLRRDFVSNVSHELRTPIASLKALTETLSDGAIEDASVAKDFLGKMNVEVDKLAQMVQELGDLSQIESGQVPFKKSDIDLAEVIDRAVDRLRAQADRAGLSLTTEVQTDLPEVLADEERIEQVLVNLIHNAIKFTSPGGSIVVSATHKGDDILVSVVDTGIGIPEEALPRIFERFYKADKARTGGGTGLGLAIAKHIVQGHGGRIWAESVQGKGSTFCFTVPLSTRS